MGLVGQKETMKPPTNRDLLNELRLHRKMLVQLHGYLTGLSVFVIRAGRGELTEKQAVKLVSETADRFAAQMSEFDLDLREMI